MGVICVSHLVNRHRSFCCHRRLCFCHRRNHDLNCSCYYQSCSLNDFPNLNCLKNVTCRCCLDGCSHRKSCPNCGSCHAQHCCRMKMSALHCCCSQMCAPAARGGDCCPM